MSRLDPHDGDRTGRVVIVGAGRIGRSLARLLEDSGTPVALLDIGDPVARVAEADLIVESVTEDLATKRGVVEALRQHAPTTPLLSTTSSLLPEDLRRGDAYLGLWHPFAPLSRLRVVETTTSPDADPQVLGAARRLADATGRQLIEVGATPGLVGNRLLKHATHVGIQAADGTASIEDVDRAFLAAGFPLGPNAVVALVGVPTSLAVSERFAAAVGPRYAPPPALRRLAADPAARRAGERDVASLPEQARTGSQAPAAAAVSPDLQEAVAQALLRVRSEIEVLVEDRVADRATIATICREGLAWPTRLLERVLAGGPTDARSAPSSSP
jgi:3-hydroxyacyl-CoA dehydrogenase